VQSFCIKILGVFLFFGLIAILLLAPTNKVLVPFTFNILHLIFIITKRSDLRTDSYRYRPKFPSLVKNLYFYTIKEIAMQSITIDKKKYVLIEEKQLSKIQLLAAKNVTPHKKMSLAEGKKMAYKLIDQWEKEK
jgi:hypothetical protein